MAVRLLFPEHDGEFTGLNRFQPWPLNIYGTNLLFMAVTGFLKNGVSYAAYGAENNPNFTPPEFNQNGSVSGVTVGGQPAIKILEAEVSGTDPGDGNTFKSDFTTVIQFWALVNPPTGMPVLIELHGGGEVGGTASCASGVDQAQPFGSPQFASGSTPTWVQQPLELEHEGDAVVTLYSWNDVYTWWSLTLGEDQYTGPPVFGLGFGAHVTSAVTTGSGVALMTYGVPPPVWLTGGGNPGGSGSGEWSLGQILVRAASGEEEEEPCPSLRPEEIPGRTFDFNASTAGYSSGQVVDVLYDQSGHNRHMYLAPAYGAGFGRIPIGGIYERGVIGSLGAVKFRRPSAPVVFPDDDNPDRFTWYTYPQIPAPAYDKDFGDYPGGAEIWPNPNENTTLAIFRTDAEEWPYDISDPGGQHDTNKWICGDQAGAVQLSLFDDEDTPELQMHGYYSNLTDAPLLGSQQEVYTSLDGLLGKTIILIGRHQNTNVLDIKASSPNGEPTGAGFNAPHIEDTDTQGARFGPACVGFYSQSLNFQTFGGTFNGRLARLIVWDHALTDCEVEGLIKHFDDEIEGGGVVVSALPPFGNLLG